MGTDLAARIAQLLREYRATRANIEALHNMTGSLRVNVRAPDRSVTVGVDRSGALRELRIDAAIGARLGWDGLSRSILAASGLATAQAREQLRSTMREGLPERLRDLVAADGSVDLAAMLPAELDDLLRAAGGRR